VRAFGVEPHDPFGGGQLDLVDVAPGSLSVDEFILELKFRRQADLNLHRICCNRSSLPPYRQ
jgi:hypothetical protein